MQTIREIQSKAITTVSAREFARDLAHAKKAADRGPVIVTDRGRPRYALLSRDASGRLPVGAGLRFACSPDPTYAPAPSGEVVNVNELVALPAWRSG